jgi:hypothetical protein
LYLNISVQRQRYINIHLFWLNTVRVRFERLATVDFEIFKLALIDRHLSVNNVEKYCYENDIQEFT